MIIEKKASHYQAVFKGESSDEVLRDLSEYCHLFKPTSCVDGTGAMDPQHSARMEGRREVILRIIEMLNFDFAELSRMRKAQKEMF